MIAYPDSWESVGQPISIKQIEDTLMSVISSINCDCIALSEGIDSSLLMWFMWKTNRRINAFTIGSSDVHPDVENARHICKVFGGIHHRVYEPHPRVIEANERDGDLPGDVAVRLFYDYVSQYTDRIIAGDGIDEFMCGYYAHQKSPPEAKYYDILSRLQDEQLKPLDRNSAGVKVFLPYLAPEVTNLLSRIPISSKVNAEQRKILMVEMASDKLPDEIIKRRKYGFCDAFQIKETANATT